MTIRQGKFVYLCDGTQRASENWRVQTSTNGTRHIGSTRDAGEYGAYLEVSATIAITGDGDYRFVMRATPDGPILKSAIYRQRGGQLWCRTKGSNTQSVGQPGGSVFFPLMRVFTGDAILETLRRGGESDLDCPINLDAR
jgi:hypothetical protein